MGRSAIDHQGHEVWENDGIIQIYMAMLVQSKHVTDSPPWLAELAVDWNDESKKQTSGCVDSYLDKYITNQERQQFFHAFLGRINTELANIRVIKKEVLNGLSVAGGGFADDIEAEKVANFGKSFQELFR